MAKRHTHDWHLAELRRFSNAPKTGWADWACECGAVKRKEIREVKK